MSWIKFPRDTELIQAQEPSNPYPRRTSSDPRMGRSASCPLTPQLPGAGGSDTSGRAPGDKKDPGQPWSTAGLGGGEWLPALTRGDTSALQWYLVRRVSRQTGRYLSNRMVRLALSDCTSLLSIQLLTGAFQPRSEGLMYRIPRGAREETRVRT